MWRKIKYPAFLLILLLVLACTKKKEEDIAPPPSGNNNNNNPPASDNHLTMGNPSNATSDTADYLNYLMQKPQYSLSYNRDKGIPNWVSWYLGNEWLGSTSRQDDFRSDNTLPSGWYHVNENSYSNSGFDRGHLCPSADRTSSVESNSATFLMTNIIPQAPTNNQQTWADLEGYCRKLVSQGNELYIIAGGYGSGGSGSLGGTTYTVDNGRVSVPNRTWKVIVVLPVDTNDAQRVAGSTRVIAVDMPNSNSISTDWGIYRTSVDAIESSTTFNFLSNVSDSIQAIVEAKVDDGPTQ